MLQKLWCFFRKKFKFFAFRQTGIIIFVHISDCFDLPGLLKTDLKGVKCDISFNNYEPVTLRLK